MRVAVLTLRLIASAVSGVALAQSNLAPLERTANAPEQESAEEIIVRGRSLRNLRLQVDTTRERAYQIFNEINSDDQFDVHCREERRTGTRATRRVCRARFESRISADAAKEYMSALAWACPGGGTETASCMFSDRAQGAISRAQGVEGEAPIMRARMNQEILRLARENEAFAQAILDYYEATQQYEGARRRRGD